MMTREDNGFTLIELMLVVAIIGIIAAIAVPGLMRARMSGNEASAIGSMRAISSAQATFASSCGGGGYANTLADLGKPPTLGSQATFITPDLAAAAPGGTPKSGYEFTITGAGAPVWPGAETCNVATDDTTTLFFAQGDPASPGTTGTRYFAVDASAQVRQDTAQLADMTAGIPLQ